MPTSTTTYTTRTNKKDTTTFIEHAKALIIARADKMGLDYTPDDIVHVFEADYGDIVWLRTIWAYEATTTGTVTKVAIPVMSVTTNFTHTTHPNYTAVDAHVRLWCRLPQLIITRDLTGEIHSLNYDIVPFDIIDNYTGTTYDMTQLCAAQHKG